MLASSMAKAALSNLPKILSLAKWKGKMQSIIA
jgi:hypothetical protein